MKKLLLFTLLSSIYLIVSCKKDNTSTNSSGSGLTGKPFYFKIDGKSREPMRSYYYGVNGSGDSPILLEAENLGPVAESYDIRIYIHTKQQGVYAFNNVKPYAIIHLYDGEQDYKSTSGSITITKLENNKISGTFFFTAFKDNVTSIDSSKKMEITAGEFNNIAYTQ